MSIINDLLSLLRNLFVYFISGDCVHLFFRKMENSNANRKEESVEMLPPSFTCDSSIRKSSLRHCEKIVFIYSLKADGDEHGAALWSSSSGGKKGFSLFFFFFFLFGHFWKKQEFSVEPKEMREKRKRKRKKSIFLQRFFTLTPELPLWSFSSHFLHFTSLRLSVGKNKQSNSFFSIDNRSSKFLRSMEQSKTLRLFCSLALLIIQVRWTNEKDEALTFECRLTRKRHVHIEMKPVQPLGQRKRKNTSW